MNGQTVHFSVGLYPDGRPGEVFIDLHRTGTMVRAWAEASAKLMSLMLQYGAPLSELVGAMAGHGTEPYGTVEVNGHDVVTESSGVLDAIVRVMAQDFLAKELDTLSRQTLDDCIRSVHDWQEEHSVDDATVEDLLNRLKDASGSRSFSESVSALAAKFKESEL